MITEEKAIDTIYDINCLSEINQIMFKIMKSEALLVECGKRIETQARIQNYRYNKMLELQEYIENILPIDYKF